ncbi:MAG: hypothetical protein JWO95_312 [Verrucomicrobiales bacterium]|nr:hypothetical protein [Verrucomicrobiales bacterium]
MKISEFKKLLVEHSTKNVRFVLPIGSKVPPHAHVTEVARIDKRFVDCGGTFRTESVCRLQTWFQNDTEHRLTAGKLAGILDKAGSFLGKDDLEVDVEYEAPFISQFPIESIEADGESLVLQLGLKHTACLAEDKCMPPKPISFEAIPTFKAPQKCCG